MYIIRFPVRFVLVDPPLDPDMDFIGIPHQLGSIILKLFGTYCPIIEILSWEAIQDYLVKSTCFDVNCDYFVFNNSETMVR